MGAWFLGREGVLGVLCILVVQGRCRFSRRAQDRFEVVGMIFAW